MPTTAPPRDPVVRHLRARIAHLSRTRSAADDDLAAARRELAAIRLAARIDEAVTGDGNTPPLTIDQRRALAKRLSGVVR